MTVKEEFDNARIHDLQEDIPSNSSGNRPFRDVLQANLQRRAVVQGGLTLAASGFLAPSALAASGAAGSTSATSSGELVGFTPLSIEEAAADPTMPSISEDYEYSVLIPWGTPIRRGAALPYRGDPDTRPSADDAANQIGIGHDGMWFFPIDAVNADFVKDGYVLSNTRGLLCVNHEFGRNSHVMGKDAPETLEDVRLSQHVHGVSVVEVVRRNGWRMANSSYNRRIHVNTPVEFSGPVAGSAMLDNEAANMPLGTVNNCGSGPTPWGTYVTCEENFNGYFGATSEAWEPTEEQDRYGFTNTGFGYAWEKFDDRFDLSNEMYANESNRFGWCVEIDPFDPTSAPVKRTALGRVKHEAIAIAESRSGRIAAYMGDDQRFDYCYKYTSNRPWRAYGEGESPLDDGNLYVARFNDDGTGDWIWLNIANEEYPELAARFSSQAELLVYTRIAADIVGATPMDRPEWTTIGLDGCVFWTLTNNSAREEANAANPEAPNNDGHIIRTVDADDHMGDTFTWDIYILASSSAGTEGTFTDPDAAWADDEGRLFIGTDGGQPDGLEDQLVVFDTTQASDFETNPPVAKRLFCGVASDEITGYATTPDYETAFINMQHPGNGDPTATNFPAETDGVTIPRDCTIVLTRKGGGRIGS